MELNELRQLPYEEMSPEEQKGADDATMRAIRLGDAIVEIVKTLERSPAVALTALVYASMRTIAEAAKEKDGALRMLQKSADQLTKDTAAFDALWRVYGGK